MDGWLWREHPYRIVIEPSEAHRVFRRGVSRVDHLKPIVDAIPAEFFTQHSIPRGPESVSDAVDLPRTAS